MGGLLKITDIIGVETLQKIQDSFAAATHLAAVTVDHQGNRITKDSNFSSFCRLMRDDKCRGAYCQQSDLYGGSEAARLGKPFIYICHGGLVDLAVPIMVKGDYLGAILAGQVRVDISEMKDLPLGMPEQGRDFFDDPEIQKRYEAIPLTSLKQVKASANLLYTIANYLVEKQMTNIIQEELHHKNLELMEAVRLKSEVESSLQEADLKALQAQVNPHFLFNVLNTIGRLALLEGADKTQDIIYAFSDMMRYTLKKEKHNLVSIKEEIGHVQNYLSIQKMRLGKRLDYEIDIDQSGEDILCPFMTVQPFVENAIVHAIEPNAGGGKVLIAAKASKDRVILKISDDGIGISEKQVAEILAGTYQPADHKNTGIGINNTNKRLKYYYGDKYGIDIKAVLGGGTEITIKLPRKSPEGRGL